MPQRRLPEPIKGIFITSNPDAILKDGRLDFRGVGVVDLDFPVWPDPFQAYLSSHLGKRTTKQELKDLKKNIIHYLRTSTGRPLNLHVGFTIRHGVVQVFINERRIGKITYKGGKYFHPEQIAYIFDIHHGELVDKEKIRNHFYWLNLNVFHQSVIKFTPSKEVPGDVDILLTTKDSFPVRFSFAAANTGTPSIGKENLSGSVTWGNAFWRNDVLTYTFSASNIAKRSKSHTLNYLTYLPWEHQFSVFGNYSKTRPQVIDTRSISNSNQLRVRYSIPYKPLYTRFAQAMTYGFDLKYGHGYSLNTKRAKAKPSIKVGQVSQLVANYTMSNVTTKHVIGLSLNVYWSPGRLFEHQKKADFSARRAYSQVHYAYFNFNVTDLYHLPAKFELASSLTLQKATATLPGSETFTLGGYNTVRGYHPNEFNSDNGLLVNIELRTPPTKPLKHFYKNVDDKFFALGFIDYGIGDNYNHSSTNPKVPKDRLVQWALGMGEVSATKSSNTCPSAATMDLNCTICIQ